MQKITTVASLKRALTVGQKIEMVRYNGQAPTERIAGIGTVSKVQTNGVYITRNGKDSWLDFPKASELSASIERVGHFEINNGGNYAITLEYRLVA